MFIWVLRKIHHDLTPKIQNLCWKSLEEVLRERYDIYKRKYIYEIDKEDIFNLPYGCY